MKYEEIILNGLRDQNTISNYNDYLERVFLDANKTSRYSKTEFIEGLEKVLKELRLYQKSRYQNRLLELSQIETIRKEKDESFEDLVNERQSLKISDYPVNPIHVFTNSVLLPITLNNQDLEYLENRIFDIKVKLNFEDFKEMSNGLSDFELFLKVLRMIRIEYYNFVNERSADIHVLYYLKFLNLDSFGDVIKLKIDETRFGDLGFDKMVKEYYFEGLLSPYLLFKDLDEEARAKKGLEDRHVAFVHNWVLSYT